MFWRKPLIFSVLALLELAFTLALPAQAEVNNLIFDGNQTINLRHLQKVTDAEGLKIFWWNVAWGNYNGDYHLDHNLKNLVDSPSCPDLLILGEFKYGAIAQSTLDFLKQHFPYSDYVPYSASSDVGILTFSLTDFKKEVVRGLDWTPVDLNKAGRDAYRKKMLEQNYSEARYWDRVYVLYSAYAYGKKYYFSPVHLLEPWAAIHQNDGKLGMMYKLFMGGENPLDFQVARYRSFLTFDIGGNLAKGQPVISIGDFNVPKEIYLLTPDLYKTLSSGLTEAFFGNPATFPTKYAERKEGRSLLPITIKIDHVFFNKQFEKVGGTALEMTGSDHYPIYTVVKPARSSSWWPF